jgi:hypothetical protein
MSRSHGGGIDKRDYRIFRNFSGVFNCQLIVGVHHDPK